MKVAGLLVASSLLPAFVQAAPVGQGHSSVELVAGTYNWVSRQGSVMVLDVASDGLIQGYFVNNAPGKGCRGIPYMLRGRVQGEAISFIVRWRNGVEDCMSETQWSGHLQRSRNGGLEMVTEWQRSSSIATVAAGDGAPQTGVDVFTNWVITGLPLRTSP